MRSLFFIKSPDRELGKSFVRKRRLYSCVSAWLRLDFKVKTNVGFELCVPVGKERRRRRRNICVRD